MKYEHRVNIYFDTKLLADLRELPGTMSANIRTAVQDYVFKIKNSRFSTSLSRKEGDEHE